MVDLHNCDGYQEVLFSGIATVGWFLLRLLGETWLNFVYQRFVEEEAT